MFIEPPGKPGGFYWGYDMKIRVLYYRAERDGHVLDDGISAWTWLFNPGTGPYSHVEIWIPHPDFGFEYKTIVGYTGMCYTSTMRGEDNGTVMRSADKVLKHPERWDYTEIDVEPRLVAHAVQMAEARVERNQGYAKVAIAGFFLPIRIQSKDKRICSEETQHFLVWCEVFHDYATWSPRRLSRKITDLGHEIKPLSTFKQKESVTS